MADKDDGRGRLKTSGMNVLRSDIHALFENIIPV
jgi:hypothetical protein